MATITWGASSGDWATGSNWVGSKAPGSADTALFSGAAIVTAEVKENDAVGSVTLDNGVATVAVYAGKTLKLGSIFDLEAGTLALAGELKGGVLETSGGDLLAENGALNGVKLEGTLELTSTSSTLHVTNLGLSGRGGLGNGYIFVTGSQSELFLDNSQTLTNGSIDIGNSAPAGHGAILAGELESGGYAIQQLGIRLTVQQTGKYAEITAVQAKDCVYNLGDIDAEYGGGHFLVTGAGTFANAGFMGVEDGDTASITSHVFDNSDELEVYAGRATVSSATFTNLGDVEAYEGGVLKITSADFTNFSTSAAGGVLTDGELDAGAKSTIVLPKNEVIKVLDGEIYLDGAGSKVESYDTATKKNVTIDQSLRTIARQGDLELDDGRAMTIAGSLTDNGDIDLYKGALTAATITNNGDIYGYGTLTAKIVNNRYIEVEDGTLKLDGAAGVVNVNTDELEAYDGGVLDFAGGTMNSLGGDIYIEGGAAAEVTSAGVLQSESTDIEHGATLTIANGSTLQALNEIDNSGVLAIASSTLATTLKVLTPGLTLTNSGTTSGGTLTLTGAKAEIVGASATATLTNFDNTISGAGQLGAGMLELDNQAAGAIIGDQALALIINTGANTITNAGLIENKGAGGTVIMSVVDNTGTLLAAGGVLTLDRKVIGAGVGQIDGGTLYAKAKFKERVTFTGTTGVLELADSVDYKSSVTGLSTKGTNSLDLLDIGFTKGVTKASYSGTASGGTLTVTDGTHTARIKLVGDYLGSTFKVSSDGHGGTTVVDPAGGAAATVAVTPFIAAAASFGATAGGSTALSAVAWRPPPSALGVPRAQFA